MRGLADRVRRRARYAQLSLTGLRVNDVVFIDATNADSVAAAYKGVEAQSLRELGGPTSVTPISLPEDVLPEFAPFRTDLESVLLDISNPEFSFRNCVLLDDHARILFSSTATREQVLFFNRYAPRRIRWLDGTVAYLSNTWIENYYHWLQLTLPLIRLYRQFLPNQQIDYYYLGETRLTQTHLETLSRLGIHRDQIVNQPCTAPRMLAAFCRRLASNQRFDFRDQFGHAFVRSLFVPPESRGAGLPKRIFVQRGLTRTRRLLNEEDVVRLVRRYGFIPVQMDGHSVAEQAALFWNAEAILGVHGAALANLVFAQSGAKVIEIFPFHVTEPSFFTAASYSGLEYYCLRGRAQGTRSKRSEIAKQHITVDLEKLQRLLQMAGLAPIS